MIIVLITQAVVLLQECAKEATITDQDMSLIHLHIGNHLKDMSQLDSAVAV